MILHVNNKFYVRIQAADDKVAAASDTLTASKDEVKRLIDLKQEITGGASSQGHDVQKTEEMWDNDQLEVITENTIDARMKQN